MSVLFSGTNQGNFKQPATAVNQTIKLPSGVDWMWVYNQTQQYAAGGGQGVQFYWQSGFTQGLGTQYTKTAATNALAISQIAANAGFFLVDSTINIPSASVALTGIDGSNPPVVFTGNTAGLAIGSVVRIYQTVGALQLQGLDFTIGTVVANTSFTLANMSPIASANPGAGSYRIIPFDPYFYPDRRVITNIKNAKQAIVTLSVTHGYLVGQEIRFVIPTVTNLAFGMTELDQVQAAIVAVGQADTNGSTNTITVDVDTTAFGAFAFPLTADGVFTPAQVVPVGANTAVGLAADVNVFNDARINTGYFGMQLIAGANSPAGQANDVIYWVAGKSFSVNNTI